MAYDRDGFRIPPQFEMPLDDPDAFGPRPTPEPPASIGSPRGERVAGPGSPSRRAGDAATSPGTPRRAGRGKRAALLLLAAAVIVPGVLGPEIMPAIREGVVVWSLDEAARREADGDLDGALSHLDRAVSWQRDDVRLLCLRGSLRLENRDASGAVDDATRAAELAPTAPQPRRLRALASTVLGRPDDALADVQAVVDLNVPGDAESLNLRAYTRALVGRDLPAALEDIEAALERTGGESPEHLDTRGYILHLLDRQHEAIDDLNRAIDGMQDSRRRLQLLRGRMERLDYEFRLRAMERGLAVMHQHRGEACAAAGFDQQARQDFEIAREKGFDPSRGIF